MAPELIRKLRDFPSVEELLQDKHLKTAVGSVGRPVASLFVKQTVESAKAEFREQKQETTVSALIRIIAGSLRELKEREINRVINATGILIHTNLGRAPLDEELFDAARKSLTGYSNLEFELKRGIRGKRGEACEQYLSVLTGASGAAIVNNCAAALFIILNSLANRRSVIISRGELVQIGGGFRIPEILVRSGARLNEIGATNVTTLADYEAAINDKTALILRVHQSNFVQKGFVQRTSLNDLVSLGEKHNLPVINDLGAGLLVPAGKLFGQDEPTVQQSVRQGASLTCFSGDKMLGGVQAGLIVGRDDLIVKIKKNPLFRTVRVDKIVLSMLEKLFTIYLNGNHLNEVKLWRMLSVTESELYQRGKEILAQLGNPSVINVEATQAMVGGGSMPEAEIASAGLVFSSDLKANALMRSFRRMTPPIIGRIVEERFMLDLRTIAPEEIKPFVGAIKKAIRNMDRTG